MAAPKTTADVKALIHQGPGAVSEDIEYEPDSYGNMDEIDEDDVEALEAAPEPEEEVPAEEATLAPDWQAIAQQQAQELTRIKAEQQEKEKADFDKFLESKPPEERYEIYKKHMEEQERAREVEQIRQQQAATHPLASMLFAPISELFDIEIDDPQQYAEAMDVVEAKYAELVAAFVDERVKQEMDKFYAETGREWGSTKLGDAQPRPLEPRNPIRGQYEQTRKEMAQPRVVKTVDDLTKLVRQRQMAK